MRRARDEIYAAMHPSRYEILSELARKPSYASRLEQVLKINRKVITFHLAVLQQYKLIEGQFKLKNDPGKRPIAVKYFRPTKKGKAVLAKITAL
jgi:predicted transcriptional regulator